MFLLVIGTLSLSEISYVSDPIFFIYCNNCVQHSLTSSKGGGHKVLGLRPICDCGEVIVLRTTRTPKNVGRKFLTFKINQN